MCFSPQPRVLFRDRIAIELSKVVQNPGVLYIFTSKCASRHSNMHFFDRRGPNPRCFVHFHFEMCSHRNGVHFFNISTSKSRPYVTALTPFTSKCASRHNGVHFFNISTSKSHPSMRCCDTFYFQMCFAPQQHAIFLSHLPRCLRTPCFSEPTFRPPGATKH